MIHNIVFDIGQVLAEFRWKELIQDLGYTDEISERIGRATVLSPHWNEVDRGLLSLNEIIEECVALDKEIEEPIRHFFRDQKEIVVEFDYSERLIRSLKERGYKVYILSNYGERNFSYVREKFHFLPIVDGGVISYEIKKTKPEPEIYQALIDKYAIKPEESVFLDDVEKNILGAKKMGFHTVHFQNLEQALQELKKLGVEIV